MRFVLGSVIVILLASVVVVVMVIGNAVCLFVVFFLRVWLLSSL